MDGSIDIDTVLRTLDDDSLLTDEDRQHYHTLGGLAMFALGRVPQIGDIFERGPFRFEIVDMDGNRVDRLLVGRTPPPPGEEPTIPTPARSKRRCERPRTAAVPAA
jgi:putative hemolysin